MTPKTVRLSPLVLLLALGDFATTARAVTLEQVLSREQPDLNINGKLMGVGRDGRVYVGDFSGYVVRYNPDGTGKWGGKTPMALKNVTANANGVIASGHVHMAPALRMWTPMFQVVAAVTGIANSDASGWNAPSGLDVGPSGDFYMLDQTRECILRTSPTGKLIATNSLAVTGEKYLGRYARLKVVESLQRFYVCSENGVLHALTFDGKKLWTIQGPTFDGFYFSAGDGFEADDDGNIYILKEGEDVISILDSDGKPKGTIQLKGGDPKGKCIFLELWKDDIFIKRKHPTEMFQVYDRQTGEYQRTIHANVDKFSVEFPSQVWTAGQLVPLTISLQSADKTTHPNWPVQISRFNDPEWMTLPVVDGKITPPADASGLYRLRVQCGEYNVYDAVEIRVPDSKGTVNILSPSNRLYYGRGEEIPVKVIVRGPQPSLNSVTVNLQATAPHPDPLPASGERGSGLLAPVAGERIKVRGNTVWTTNLSLSVTQPTTFSLSITALAPGKYLLTADAPGFTVAPQPLIIGPGMAVRSAFSYVEYTDGGGQRTPGTYRDLPESVAAHIQRTLKTGSNLFIDYADGSPGYQGAPNALGLEPIVERLKQDPLGVAPEKAAMEEADFQALAAYSAYGLEKMNLLIWVDSVAPFGDPVAHSNSLVATAKGIQDRTTARLSYPAFRGWDWFEHLWVMPDSLRTNNEMRTAWAKLRDTALATGKWDPAIEADTDLTARLLPAIGQAYTTALHEVAPNKISAMSGPYRHPYVIPPITFAPADEVDLHFQAEQIAPPQTPPHSVDYYKRPGKRAWGHPEVYNDDGTGAQMSAALLQMVMRGADGAGVGGRLWRGGGVLMGVGMGVNDPRIMGRGAVSVQRALAKLLRQYGPWLTTLQASDQVVIPVSTRMLRLDEWNGKLGGGGLYFTRLYEAYQACLYAHRPASFVFTEDLQPGQLQKYKAVLLVGQMVELDPALATALEGANVYFDGTCREELVKQFKPLNLTFNRVETDHSLWNDDTMYHRWPRFFQEQAAKLTAVIGTSVPPVAKVDNSEIMLTERRNGEGRFVWAVNNTQFDWDLGYMWRVSSHVAQRQPQVLPIDLNATGQTVYEIFAMKPAAVAALYERRSDASEAADGGHRPPLQLDLQTMPARLFAVLPKPIQSLKLSAPGKVKAGDAFEWKVTITGPKMTYPLQVRLTDEAGKVIEELYPTTTTGSITVPLNASENLTLEATELISGKSARVAINGSPRREEGESAPAEQFFGPHLRDVAVSADGATAFINAANWTDNYYLLDTQTGNVRQQNGVGHHYAYGPVAAGKRFFAQGYDINSIEGYHLYEFNADGKPERRYATYGVPGRGTKWIGGCYFDERINNYTVAPKGSWIANAGNLGLVVWSSAGKKLWSLDWWQKPLDRPPVVGQDDEGIMYAYGPARQSMLLLAQDEDTLVTLEGGMIVRAWQVKTGKNRWELKLAEAGLIRGGSASADGKTLAVFADTEGGRVFVIRDGKVINTLPVMADQVLLAPDGRHLAVVVANDLRWYATDGGVLWSFAGDDERSVPVHYQLPLHEPRISSDSKRIVFGTCAGMLYVLDGQGREVFQRDCGAMPVANWLAGGDLLVATWMGDVMRLDANGGTKWKVKLAPKNPVRQPAISDATPTSRMAWGNATAKPDALTPNLLKQVPVQISTANDRPPYSPFGALENPAEILYDGQTTPPKRPWLTWSTVQIADSGWTGKWTLIFDFGTNNVHLTGVTVVEDPAYPRSWMRDVLLQYWDAQKGWLDGSYLLSDAATHTHHFEKPIDAAKFRLIGRDIKGWPVGNLRFGEIVFHGNSIAP